MLEDKDEYMGKVPYEIIEYGEDYDICQVEVEDISEIVIDIAGNLYKPYEIAEYANGNYVSVWELINWEPIKPINLN